VRELLPLLQQNWAELETKTFELDPLFDDYLNWARVGALKYLTVRDDGVLVGYAILMIARSLYYAGVKMGEANVIWLHPDWRSGTTGLEMLHAIEQRSRDLGVQQLQISEKTVFERKRGGLGKILRWMGFTEVERVHEKVL
jgi:N-acetylglutamate synthase-like GNAT family acetyltransferase